MIGRRWLGPALCAALLGAAGAAAAQAAPRFGVRAAEGDGRVVVAAQDLLADQALLGALASGLPLRFRLRVELWRKGLFDQLVEAEEIGIALIQDPLDRAYRLENGRTQITLASLAETQQALERALRPSLQPRRRGRFYYLAQLEVETLSLSDLEELRRWLRGEVQPAVEGRGSAGRAVERGMRRVLVRVIGLPTRRYEARSGTFVRR